MTKHLAEAALLLAAVAIFQGAALFYLINREIDERRDTSCDAAEKAYREEIAELRDDYDLYVDPPKGLEQVLKDPRAVESLREAERDVRRDDDEFGQFVAPSCDEPGFGLDEPDPEIPDRPLGLR